MRKYKFETIYDLGEELDKIIVQCDEQDIIAPTASFISKISCQVNEIIASTKPQNGCLIYSGTDAFVMFSHSKLIGKIEYMDEEESVFALYDDLVHHLKSSSQAPISKKGIEKAMNTVNQLFNYSTNVLDENPISVMLVNTQHNEKNAESTAYFKNNGINGAIRYYCPQKRYGDNEKIYIFLHELGHLVHMAYTGTICEVPPSFRNHLSDVGVRNLENRTDAELLEIFADTFLIAVTTLTTEFGDPFPEIQPAVKFLCAEYMKRTIKTLEERRDTQKRISPVLSGGQL